MMGSRVQPSAINERPAPAQVLLRGLSLLEALNRRAVGSVEELAQDSRLPKSTIVRMLNTLVLAGYPVLPRATQRPARNGAKRAGC